MNQALRCDRRTAAAVMAAVAAAPTAGADESPRTQMGLVIYDCKFRRQWMRADDPSFDLFEPMNFLRHCHSLGAGGMQASLGTLDSAATGALRDYADRNALFIEAIVKLPASDHDVARFESEIKTARDVGANAVRTTIMPGRRYEQFSTYESFQESEQRGRRMLERAAPIVERHRVRLAVENHKDQRIEERVALLEDLSCEFIGACVDTGNSFALLDGAYEPIEALAPYAFTVHLKDQALQSAEGGFLLGDIPLGQGSFDLPRIVQTLRKAKPEIRFSLELITRDPLRVPCLTTEYYATLPRVHARDLARTLLFVRKHAVKRLQQVSGLSLRQQVELEDQNVAASLEYAREVLAL